MAKHKRQEIREAIVSRLKAADTGAGDNVFANRFLGIPTTKDFPLISAYTLNETARKNEPQELHITEVDTRIMAYVKGNDSSEIAIGEDPVDTILDNLLLEIENEFFKEIETLNGEVFTFNYVGTKIVIHTTGDWVATGEMSFLARHHNELFDQKTT